MMQAGMHSHSLRRREGIQLSYNLPQRIYATCVYPRPSINGSNIIICGHESGLTIVWSGGKKFKTPSHASDVNGIDLIADDENEHSNAPEYEDEEGDHDSSRIPQDVLTHVDVPLDAGASRLAIPPLPSERTIDGFPTICETHIVVAAACLDQTLRIVVIPIQPVQTKPQIQVLKLVTASMHQDLISDIAITLTADRDAEDDVGKRARSRSRNRAVDSGQEIMATNKKWSFLVASASPTGSGLLLVHQIPVDSEGVSTDPQDHLPIHHRFIRSPLVNCRLDFNPSPYPAERHSHLLIAIPDGSSVQVYNLLPQTEFSKRRRGSIATIDSASSTNRPVRQASTGAKALITLLPGFSNRHATDDLSRRKRVLDAKWIMQGRAILSLLDDGEWGIWDLEAVGPAPASRSNNLVRGQHNVSGIQGGALTRFALRGHVGSSSKKTKRKSASQDESSTSSSLAPMTPHTRKERSSGLFREENMTTPVGIEQPKGSISVSRQEPTTATRSKGHVESVILTYASSSTFIPHLLAYWRSETSAKGSFDGIGSGRPQNLPMLYPSTEELIASHLLPATAASSDGQGNMPAFISVTASKLVLIVPFSGESTFAGLASSNLPMRLMAAKSDRQDQALLDSGELDVDGMDRILDDMAKSSGEGNMPPSGFGKKSVGFQLSHHGDDGDVDMDTPTMGSNKSSKASIDKSGAGGRRLFT